MGRPTGEESKILESSRLQDKPFGSLHLGPLSRLPLEPAWLAPTTSSDSILKRYTVRRMANFLQNARDEIDKSW